VVTGSDKSVLLRGIGPTLSTFSVPNALSGPTLSLYQGSSLLKTDEAWGGSPTLSAAFSLVGAFPLAPASLDSALLANVSPGAYTAQVSGSSSGVALAEIYDADPSQSPVGRLVNISARAQVGTGEGELIIGFVVRGTTTEHLLIRAVGPGLTQFGVGGVLAAPQLNIYDAAGNLIQSNAGWGGTSDLQAAFAKTGAFPLSSTSADAALIADLPAGSYTAVISGSGDTTGVALAEIYEVP